MRTDPRDGPPRLKLGKGGNACCQANKSANVKADVMMGLRDRLRGVTWIALLLLVATSSVSTPSGCCARATVSSKSTATSGDAPAACPMHHSGELCPMRASARVLACASRSPCGVSPEAIRSSGSVLVETVTRKSVSVALVWARLAEGPRAQRIRGAFPPDSPPPRA